MLMALFLLALSACVTAAAASPSVGPEPATTSVMKTVRMAVDIHNQAAGPVMLREFRDFLAPPNVSSHHGHVLANAAWIERYVAKRGSEPETVMAGPHWLVDARW